jgi:hypothetical protein
MSLNDLINVYDKSISLISSFIEFIAKINISLNEGFFDRYITIVTSSIGWYVTLVFAITIFILEDAKINQNGQMNVLNIFDRAIIIKDVLHLRRQTLLVFIAYPFLTFWSLINWPLYVDSIFFIITLIFFYYCGISLYNSYNWVLDSAGGNYREKLRISYIQNQADFNTVDTVNSKIDLNLLSPQTNIDRANVSIDQSELKNKELDIIIFLNENYTKSLFLNTNFDNKFTEYLQTFSKIWNKAKTNYIYFLSLKLLDIFLPLLKYSQHSHFLYQVSKEVFDFENAYLNDLIWYTTFQYLNKIENNTELDYFMTNFGKELLFNFTKDEIYELIPQQWKLSVKDIEFNKFQQYLLRRYFSIAMQVVRRNKDIPNDFQFDILTNKLIEDADAITLGRSFALFYMYLENNSQISNLIELENIEIGLFDSPNIGFVQISSPQIDYSLRYKNTIIFVKKIFDITKDLEKWQELQKSMKKIKSNNEITQLRLNHYSFILKDLLSGK